MAGKLTGYHGAVGYWGRDIYQRVEAEQIPGKIRVLLQDKLLARGKDVFIWNQVNSTTPGNLQCSCVKSTTERPDVACFSCYGVGLIPGYLKFLFQTLYFSSIQAGLTLVNTSLDTTVKPHRVQLNSGFLTGTATTAAIPYSNPLSLDWEVKTDAANIVATNTLTFEFSTDGFTFNPIANINNVGLKPIGTGNLYFRVTMTRVNAEHRSPLFEILRARHATRVDPYIKILRPWVQDLPILMQYGRRTENENERFWTLPLDFFDSTITRDTPSARIPENSFYTRITGINAGTRYTMSKFEYNEEFGIFTHQSFTTRRVQPEEVYSALVF